MKAHELLHRTASPLVVVSLLSATALAAPAGGTETLPLPPTTNEELNAQAVEASNTDSDWNCLDIAIGNRALRAITPNYDHDNPVAIAAILHLTQSLVPATVLASTGQIRAWHEDGTLAAIEFHLFENDPGGKPTEEECLPLLGSITGYDPEGVPGEIGIIYLFTQAQYDARIAQLAGMMGGVPPAQYTVWLGAVLHSASTKRLSMTLSGIANVIDGALRSNGDLWLACWGYVAPDTHYYATNSNVSGGGNVFGPLVKAAGYDPDPLARDAGAYLAAAQAAGTYFTGDVSIVADPTGAPQTSAGQPLSGVVYATRDITVGSGVVGALTLVAEGVVSFPGNDAVLDAAVDETLAISLGASQNGGVVLSGSGSRLSGSLHAPSAAITLSGGGNHWNGRAAGATIRLSGTGNVLGDGTR